MPQRIDFCDHKPNLPFLQDRRLTPAADKRPVWPDSANYVLFIIHYYGWFEQGFGKDFPGGRLPANPPKFGREIWLTCEAILVRF